MGNVSCFDPVDEFRVLWKKDYALKIQDQTSATFIYTHRTQTEHQQSVSGAPAVLYQSADWYQNVSSPHWLRMRTIFFDINYSYQNK